jgi:hypothetical protein
MAQKNLKGRMISRIDRISICIQNNDSYGGTSEDFSEALKWIRHYWQTHNFLPSFGDTITDNSGESWIVVSRSFFINDMNGLEIYVMHQKEFNARIFRMHKCKVTLSKHRE